MSLSDLLNSTGGASFKFDQIGAKVTGTITSADVVQKRNFDTNEPEVWSDGQPVQQVKISLQTTLRDPANSEDDGIRNIYVKGWGDDLRALKAAIKAAGGTDLEVGGQFSAEYIRNGELAPGKRGFPPKVKAYEYTRPSATAGLLADQAAAAPAATAAPAAAAPASAAAAVPGLTPEQMQAVLNYQAAQAEAQAG
jgi:hypothetical protein